MIKSISFFLLFFLSFPLFVWGSNNRIVSTSPHITEILYKLGVGDRVVGVTSFCNYPPDAKKKAKIGAQILNTEAIIKLKPDLLLLDSSVSNLTAADFKKYGITVLVVNCSSFPLFRKSVKEIATCVGTERRGAFLLKKMDAELSALAPSFANKNERKKVFIEIWNMPLMSAGKGTFIDDIIRAAGGINVAAMTISGYAGVSSEFLLKNDPDVILLTVSESKNLPPSWKSMKAYKNGKIFNINRDIYVRPSFRMVNAVKELNGILYPARKVKK